MISGRSEVNDWLIQETSHLLCVKEQQTLGYNFCVRAPHEQTDWGPVSAKLTTLFSFLPILLSHPLLLELSLAHHPTKIHCRVWFEETLPKITSIRSKPGKQVLRTSFLDEEQCLARWQSGHCSWWKADFEYCHAIAEELLTLPPVVKWGRGSRWEVCTRVGQMSLAFENFKREVTQGCKTGWLLINATDALKKESV